MDLVIVGGGFGGLWAAMAAAAARTRLGLSEAELSIELVSKEPDLIVRPRLYEGAKEDMRVALAPLLEEVGVTFRQRVLEKIMPEERCLAFRDGGRSFDSLVLATGSHMPLPAVPGAKEFGFSVDTYEDAERLDNHLQRLKANSPESSRTAVVVGAGFTGIEVATELRSRLGPAARIILADRANAVGQELGDNIRPEILKALDVCGITPILNCQIAEIKNDCLVLHDGKPIATETAIFATGLVASDLTRAFDCERDEKGRLIVDEYLHIGRHRGVFVAGDTARALTDGKHPSLQSCQHAIQLGRYAGHNAVQYLADREKAPYRQEFYSTCLDVGAAGAIYAEGWGRHVKRTGYEGKETKKFINRTLIYPPKAEKGRDAIFKEVGIDSAR